MPERIARTAAAWLLEHFGIERPEPAVQPTRKEFEGAWTLVLFPYTGPSKKSPEALGQELGAALVESLDEVEGFNVVKGFLNLSLHPKYWAERLDQMVADVHCGGRATDENAAPEVVEYSSPNTNKPLHLGHVRNNLLGHSVAEMLQAIGRKVVRVQVINDRGIHICKSMVAYRHFGAGETPETAGLKGDHLVGKYYVAFDREYKRQIEELKAQGRDEESAGKQAPILLEAQEMLRQWEQGDAEVRALWTQMNEWVYAGFAQTYAALGVRFDRNYYESETYVLGKAVVEQGLSQGVFERRPDGSVWIDLSAEKLDEKLLLRKDGTSVYITQDLGTALSRHEDFGMRSMVYVVGNEQEYHFQVLFAILRRLGYDWAGALYHLSYGMVRLPEGKMKSREGTVVDADDLLGEMVDTARALSEELGKTEGMDEAEKQALYRMLGHGALKYFILKVDPVKDMVFNPKESIDFDGHTGPFIQYTHARIRSLERKAQSMNLPSWDGVLPDAASVVLIRQLDQWSGTLHSAAVGYNPALVANYVYELTKMYNAWYQNHSVLNNDDPAVSAFRLRLSAEVGRTLRKAMGLLGIECPERM